MQRSDLEAEIGRLCGDPNNTRWLTSVIDTRLDAAELDVLIWTNAVKTATSYTPVADTAEVVVSSNIMDILDGRFTLSDGTVISANRGFDPISRWDLDLRYPNWRNMSSSQPRWWSFDASTKSIILTPKPASAYISTNALTLLEVRQPTTPMSQGSSTSIPFDSNALMVPYHRALVYWVVSENMKDNNDADSLSKAKFFRSNDISRPGEYEKEIKKILMKFDAPEAVPAQVYYKPQGGRISGNGQISKSNPLLWGS